MHRETALPLKVLVERSQDGDDRAFEELVRRHQDTVHRIALRVLRDPGDARDAAQEALVTAWRRLPELADPRSFPAWVNRIVGRRALNMLRARGPVDPVEHDDRLADPEPGPVGEALAGGLREALHDALSGLPPSQRICWVLREMEGLGYEEIAEIVDTTPTAVRGRIHRARTHLVEALEPWR